jgi:hypothetical protein
MGHEEDIRPSPRLQIQHMLLGSWPRAFRWGMRRMGHEEDIRPDWSSDQVDNAVSSICLG